MKFKRRTGPIPTSVGEAGQREEKVQRIEVQKYQEKKNFDYRYI